MAHRFGLLDSQLDTLAEFNCFSVDLLSAIIILAQLASHSKHNGIMLRVVTSFFASIKCSNPGPYSIQLRTPTTKSPALE